MPFTSASLLPLMSRAHRWLGIALCMMLALWFLTGSVISFVPFPTLGETERLASSEPLSVGDVRISPSDALAAAVDGVVRRLRLFAVDGEPRYLLTHGDGKLQAISAIDARPLPPLEAAAAQRVAERFAGSSAREVTGPLAYDQWTIHDKYPALRPLFRIALADAADTEVYVSSITGQVVQRTNRWQRRWNRAGAVIHWLNVPALRVAQPLWHRTIWTIAFAAMLLVMLGLTIGWIRYFGHRRRRGRGLTPFRGALRAHHALGLFAGWIALSWVGSGWLSLDQARWFPSDQPGSAQASTYASLAMRDIAAAWPLDSLHSLPATGELEWRAIHAQPLVVLRPDRATPQARVLIRNDRGVASIEPGVPQAWVRDAIAAAWAPARMNRLERVRADDAWQLRNYPWPPGTLRAELDDAAATWVHIDPASGEIISVMDRGRRVYRWLGDGLHQFDFPWLNRSTPLWHALLLLAMATGLVFSASGIVLAWRRVRRAIT